MSIVNVSTQSPYWSTQTSSLFNFFLSFWTICVNPQMLGVDLKHQIIHFRKLVSVGVNSHLYRLTNSNFKFNFVQYGSTPSSQGSTYSIFFLKRLFWFRLLDRSVWPFYSFHASDQLHIPIYHFFKPFSFPSKPKSFPFPFQEKHPHLYLHISLNSYHFLISLSSSNFFFFV